MDAGAKPATKGEKTRELILATALRLFRERGYDATTMRAIASEAGVSVGNAYYYFDSKDHLIQAFYDDIGRQHREIAVAAVGGETDFGVRLRTSLRLVIDVMQPYHGFAGEFFKTAADPSSPSSPFSDASGPARQKAIDYFRALVTDSDLKVPKALREELPELLWLHQMGIILYWVHDPSGGAERTYELIDRTTPIVVRLVGLARLPMLRSIVEDVVSLARAMSGREPLVSSRATDPTGR